METTQYGSIPYPEPADPTTTWEYWQQYAETIEAQRGVTARVFDTTPQAFPTGFNDIEFGNVDYQFPGGVWNSTDHRFVAPSDGLYEVKFSALIDYYPGNSANAIGRGYIKLWQTDDDNAVAERSHKSGLGATDNAFDPSASASRIVPARAGDGFSAGVWRNSESDVSATNAIGDRWFTIRKVGPFPEGIDPTYALVYTST